MLKRNGERAYPSLVPDLLFFFFLGTPHSMGNFLGQGLNPHHVRWKCRVLTTGPPGKPLYVILESFKFLTIKYNVSCRVFLVCVCFCHFYLILTTL